MKRTTDNTNRKAHDLDIVGYSKSTDNKVDYATQTSPEKIAFLQRCRFAVSGNGRKQQCQRLLPALQRYGVTTYEARQYLDIYHPAGRAKELRDQGWDIETHWQIITTDNGGKHRVGVYTLKSKPRG